MDRFVHGSILLVYLTGLTLILLLSVGLWERARPAWQQWQAKQLLDEMQQVLTRARWAAMLTHAAVKVCGSSAGHQCDGDWNRQWLWVSPSGKVLQRFVSQLRGWKWLSSTNFVQFNPGGHSAGYQRSWTLISNTHSSMSWGKLVLMHSGRVRVAFHH